MGLGLMLLGIRSHVTIMIIMLVSSTGLTSGLVCAYTHIKVHTYIHSHKSDSKSDMSTYYSQNGCQVEYVEVNTQMCCHPET